MLTKNETAIATVEILKQKIINQHFLGGNQKVIEAGKITEVEIVSRQNVEEIESRSISLLVKYYGENHSLTKDFLTKLKLAKNSSHLTYFYIKIM